MASRRRAALAPESGDERPEGLEVVGLQLEVEGLTQRRGELGLGGQGALLAPVEVGGEQGAPPESEVEGRGSALDDEPGDEDGGRVGLEALALAGEELWVGRVGEEVEAEGLAQEGLGEAPVAVFEGARAS